MIILKSKNTLNITKGSGEILNTNVYALCEFIKQNSTHFTFREMYYYIEERQEVNPNEAEDEPEYITTAYEIFLPESNERKTIPIKVEDFGENPTPEEQEYNNNTLDYLFQQHGSAITKDSEGITGTGYSEGIEQSFDNIFLALQNQTKYNGVTEWVVMPPLD